MSRIWDAMKQAERERELHVVPDDLAQQPLSKRQMSALDALVDCPTMAEASARSGISERTLRRWLAEPRFMAVFRRMTFARCGEAVVALQAASTDAVRVLRQALDSKSVAVRVRAAIAILDLAVRAELGEPAPKASRSKRARANG